MLSAVPLKADKLYVHERSSEANSNSRKCTTSGARLKDANEFYPHKHAQTRDAPACLVRFGLRNGEPVNTTAHGVTLTKLGEIGKPSAACCRRQEVCAWTWPRSEPSS